MGGPDLIFDHQMCMDQENRVLYVFGGQSLGLVLRGNLNCNCLIDFLLGTNDSSFHEKNHKEGKNLAALFSMFLFPNLAVWTIPADERSATPACTSTTSPPTRGSRGETTAEGFQEPRTSNATVPALWRAS